MYNGIWLVASEALTSAECGQDVEEGERFETSRSKYAGALLAQRKATIAPKIPAAPEPPAPRRRGRPRKITTSTITAESTNQIDETRTYHRRDLEAEE